MSSYTENNLIYLHSENIELRRQQQLFWRNLDELRCRLNSSEEKINYLQKGAHFAKRRHFGRIKHQNLRWSRAERVFAQQEQFNWQINQQLQQIHQRITEMNHQLPSPHAKSVLEWLNKLSQPPVQT
jgi:hypothetical protein